SVGAQPSLSMTKIRKFKISLPEYSEQTAIAEILSDMDAEIAALEARREKTHLLKEGMMQELLTGRTRLV
ncbi:MAG: restriction endonuclease subunit S, partial [Chloroflexi bacterium]